MKLKTRQIRTSDIRSWKPVGFEHNSKESSDKGDHMWEEKRAFVYVRCTNRLFLGVSQHQSLVFCGRHVAFGLCLFDSIQDNTAQTPSNRARWWIREKNHQTLWFRWKSVHTLLRVFNRNNQTFILKNYQQKILEYICDYKFIHFLKFRNKIH